MITAVFVTGTLIVGGAGSIVNTAAAHKTPVTPVTQTNPTKPTTTETTPKVEPVVVAPVAPVEQPVQPPAAPVVATPPAQRFAVQPAVEQPVVAPATVPVDTAPEIVTMTTARAAADSLPVTYTNERMSFVTRDRLIILAAVAATTGALLYMMSLIGASRHTEFITLPGAIR
jgi:hypothetical protein